MPHWGGEGGEHWGGEGGEHWGGEGGEEMLQDRPEQRSQAGSSQGWRFGEVDFARFLRFGARCR